MAGVGKESPNTGIVLHARSGCRSRAHPTKSEKLGVLTLCGANICVSEIVGDSRRLSWGERTVYNILIIRATWRRRLVGGIESIITRRTMILLTWSTVKDKTCTSTREDDVKRLDAIEEFVVTCDYHDLLLDIRRYSRSQPAPFQSQATQSKA